MRRLFQRKFSPFPQHNKSALLLLLLLCAHVSVRPSVCRARERDRERERDKKNNKMSDVYSLEPPTKGKVILETTFGDIDIELFGNECPLACRAFVRLCVDGYYEQNVFHRILKDFMVQTGDKSGSGRGSGVEKKFKDEFHSRIKFNKRGQVAMANEGKRDSNGASFVETMFFFLRFARSFLLLCSTRASRFILSLSLSSACS
jgi:cyclophilin family peptidyl-prolyl cis-trans isomerase